MNRSAEDIGRALGRVQARLDAWRRQRDEIAAELRQVVSDGQAMLAELVGGVRRRGRRVAAAVGRPRAVARPAAPVIKRGRPVGFKVSAATRAKLRAAWRRRKAAQGKV
jgi:hypothetical protein